MRNVPYSTDSTVPSASQQLIDHALQMNRFEVEKDTIGDIIYSAARASGVDDLLSQQRCAMLVLPSLMAAIVISIATSPATY